MARLMLGVRGGIAAYKALELARLAIKAGHAVRNAVIRSTFADARYTFAWLSENASVSRVIKTAVPMTCHFLRRRMRK